MPNRSRTLTAIALLAATLVIGALLVLLRSGGSAAEPTPVGRGERPSVHTLADLEADEQRAADTRASVPVSVGASAATQTKQPVGGLPLLRVQVVSLESGRPLADEHVIVRSRDGTMGLPAHGINSTRGRMLKSDDSSLAPKTDDDGWAEIEVVPDLELLASVDPADYGRAELDVAPMAPSELRELVLRVPTTNDILFYGRLIAAVDRRPIRDGLVVLDHQSKDMRATTPTTTQTTRSDAEGIFQLSGASWRRDVASVSADGFGFTSFRLVAGHETPSQALTIPLAASATILVSAVDGVGAPLPGVRLTVRSDPFAMDQSQGVLDMVSTRTFEHWGTTSADGRCTLSELPPGVALLLRAEFAEQTVQASEEPIVLKADESRSIAIQVGGGSRIPGQILDQAGEPVADHELWMTPAGQSKRHIFHEYEAYDDSRPITKVSTDHQGRFVFESVPPGRWWIGPSPRPHVEHPEVDESAIAPVGELVVVAASQPVQHVILRADRGLFITGRVTYATGGDVPQAAIYAFPAFDLDPWQSTATAGEAEFVLGPLPAGDWDLEVTRAGAMMFPAGSRRRVASGQSGIDLQLAPGGSIRGRVVGSQPHAVDSVEVWLMSRNPAFGGGGRFVQPDGAYEWNDLPPGIYDIVARTRQGTAGVRSGIVVTAANAVDGADVVLSAGAKLTIRVAGQTDGWLVRVAQGETTVAFAMFENGHESTATVPAGLLRVELQRVARPFERPETVDSKTITLEPESEGSVVFSIVK